MVKGLLVLAAVLFLLTLLLRFVRGMSQGRRLSRGRSCLPGAGSDPLLRRMLEEAAAGGGRAREALRRIEARVATIDDVGERAAHHCAAAGVSLAVLKRPGVAAGLYMRALREDPTCLAALVQVEEILLTQKRHRALEGVCWGLLGRLDEEATGTEVWFKAWSALAKLYAENPRRVHRADAIRKMLAGVSAEAEADRTDDDDNLRDDGRPRGDGAAG
jgi:hypothetical protein